MSDMGHIQSDLLTWSDVDGDVIHRDVDMRPDDWFGKLIRDQL